MKRQEFFFDLKQTVITTTPSSFISVAPAVDSSPGVKIDLMALHLVPHPHLSCCLLVPEFLRLHPGHQKYHGCLPLWQPLGELDPSVDPYLSLPQLRPVAVLQLDFLSLICTSTETFVGEQRGPAKIQDHQIKRLKNVFMDWTYYADTEKSI